MVSGPELRNIGEHVGFKLQEAAAGDGVRLASFLMLLLPFNLALPQAGPNSRSLPFHRFGVILENANAFTQQPRKVYLAYLGHVHVHR